MATSNPIIHNACVHIIEMLNGLRSDELARLTIKSVGLGFNIFGLFNPRLFGLDWLACGLTDASTWAKRAKPASHFFSLFSLT